MLALLFILFITIPILEIAVLIQIGSLFGLFNTISLIIFTAIVGAYLARQEGLRVLIDIQNNLNQGQMPTSQLIDGFMILIAGLVLLTPGFITDVLGLFILLPFGRAVIKKLVVQALKEKTTTHNSQEDSGRNIRYFRQDDV